VVRHSATDIDDVVSGQNIEHPVVLHERRCVVAVNRDDVVWADMSHDVPGLCEHIRYNLGATRASSSIYLWALKPFANVSERVQRAIAQRFDCSQVVERVKLLIDGVGFQEVQARLVGMARLLCFHSQSELVVRLPIIGRKLRRGKAWRQKERQQHERQRESNHFRSS
jgi:hypothetical protein